MSKAIDPIDIPRYYRMFHRGMSPDLLDWIARGEADDRGYFLHIKINQILKKITNTLAVNYPSYGDLDGRLLNGWLAEGRFSTISLQGETVYLHCEYGNYRIRHIEQGFVAERMTRFLVERMTRSGASEQWTNFLAEVYGTFAGALDSLCLDLHYPTSADPHSLYVVRLEEGPDLAAYSYMGDARRKAEDLIPDFRQRLKIEHRILNKGRVTVKPHGGVTIQWRGSDATI